MHSRRSLKALLEAPPPLPLDLVQEPPHLDREHLVDATSREVVPVQLHHAHACSERQGSDTVREQAEAAGQPR